jgi:hypothetical protein
MPCASTRQRARVVCVCVCVCCSHLEQVAWRTVKPERLKAVGDQSRDRNQGDERKDTESITFVPAT